MAANPQRNLFGGGRQRFYPWLLLLPGLLAYLIINVGPSLATTIYSFTDATGIRGLAINWVGWDNYDEFLFAGGRSRDNLDALQRTLIFMVLVTTIQFGLGLVMALLVNQKLRGRMVFRTLFFVPVILGVAVQGLMWKLFLRPGGGPMHEIFSLFGMESQFLGGPNAFYWVIVVQIWANAGFSMIIFLAGLQTIPADYYEAAAVDGATGWQLFKNVTWPQLTPAVNTNFLLNIVGSLQAWMLFLVLTGYKNGTNVLGYVVYAEAFGQTGASSFRQGYAAAASIVLFVLVLVLGMAANVLVGRRERKYMS
ncbi:MAG: sugar ABC transporter permease [Acidimicrobiia bacterium]|nr:sugar ABC transporter permease [Acidimicrobiia bacterium]